MCDAYETNQSAENCLLHGSCAGLRICLVLEKLGMFFSHEITYL